MIYIAAFVYMGLHNSFEVWNVDYCNIVFLSSHAYCFKQYSGL